MKSFPLILLFITLFSTTAYMQSEPGCVKSLNSKIKSIEKKLDKLEAIANTAGSNQFQITYDQAFRDMRGIRKYQEKSCNAEKEEYDFTDLNNYINKVEERFNKISNNLESVESEDNRLFNCSRKLQVYTKYVANFPREYITKEARSGYTLEDTKAILSKAEAGNGDFQYAKGLHDEAVVHLESPNFKEAFYQTIDNEYSNPQDERSLTRLNEYCDNFDFLVRNVFPDQKQLIEMRDYVDKLLIKTKAKQSEKLADVAVNDFHAQHINKIFFTNNVQLNPEQASASDFKTNFNAGENIKAIAYLDDNYENVFGKQNEPKFHIDGTVSLRSVNIPEFGGGDWKKPYVSFLVTVDNNAYQATPGDNPGITRSIEYLAQLSPRTHQIKIQLGSYLGTTVNKSENFEVSGMLSFNADDLAGIENMKKSLVAIRDKDLQSVALPKAGMKNKAYESNLVDVFNSIGWSERFTKAIIGSTDWGYQKDYKGEVVGRILQVYMVSKTPEGGCKYQDFTVIQEKIGDNQWAKNFKRLSTGGFHDISCSKI